MPKITLVKRLVKGSGLTNVEGDQNSTKIEDYMNSVPLPDTAHNLDTYDTPGRYDQNTNAGAAAGASYPEAVAGMLTVHLGVGSNLGKIQQYHTYVGNKVYSRTQFNGTWTNWSVPNGGRALGSVEWWPLRTSVPAGRLPADGQTVSRATYPDLAAMVLAGTLPVVTESDWNSDPLKRGSFTIGDGSTTIRLPDYNGVYAGSHGALFLRGDGVLSSGTNGLIQRDALQNITGSFTTRGVPVVGGSGALQLAVGGGAQATSMTAAGALANSDVTSFDASRVARTSTETRSLNVGGVWTIHAFGTVTNPGSADAAQLASDYAVLNAQVQALQARPFAHGQCRFTAVSATQCALQPKNGRGLIINGKQCWIPTGGALVSNSGLAASTLYYAYAKDDGAGVAQVEFQAASAAPHSTHTDGVEIKTGDPTRTLVGMVYTNNPASFINSGPTRWVSSWFNRQESAMAETPVNSPTTSTSYVKLTNGLTPMLWAGDTALVAASGIVTTSVAAMGAYHIMTVNGTGFAGGHGYTLANPGYQYPSVCVAPYVAASDGIYNFALYGFSGSASAAITFRHDLNCRWPQ